MPRPARSAPPATPAFAEPGAAWRAALARRFPDLPADACHRLHQHSRRHALHRGQALLQPGQAWGHAFWVEQGGLRLYYVSAGGAESNKNFHLEDALLWPLTPWLRTQPVSFHIEALEPATVWSLDVSVLEAEVAALSSWNALRLGALSGLLEDKMRREQAFLHDSAQQRYQRLLREHPAWAERIALRHLASYLGMTDVSLSRLRARMGLIRR